MGKVCEISDAVRTEIVTKYNLGISAIAIANEYAIPRQTVYYQINKYKKTGKVNNVHRIGRNRKTTRPEDRLIIRKFQSDPFLTPKKAALEWNSCCNNHISERTVRRRLKEANINTYVARPIPFISPKNKIKRLEFAKKYVGRPSSFWQSVLWTDESSFEFHSSKKKVFVKLCQKLRKKVAPVMPKISHGGGTVMFWGSISFKGVGDLIPIVGTMNQNQYLKILNEHAFPSGDRLIGESFVLQQDNAPCHKSKMIKTFMTENCIETLDWPPQSPDLNVIENVWSYIKRKRTADLSRTREETIEEVTKLWEDIPLELLQSLINSVPNRLQKVINAKGGYIFY